MNWTIEIARKRPGIAWWNGAIVEISLFYFSFLSFAALRYTDWCCDSAVPVPYISKRDVMASEGKSEPLIAGRRRLALYRSADLRKKQPRDCHKRPTTTRPKSINNGTRFSHLCNLTSIHTCLLPVHEISYQSLYLTSFIINNWKSITESLKIRKYSTTVCWNFLRKNSRAAIYFRFAGKWVKFEEVHALNLIFIFKACEPYKEPGVSSVRSFFWPSFSTLINNH